MASQPFYKNLIVYIVAGIIIFIFLQWVSVRTEFKSIFGWWNSFGGAKYNRLFSLYAFLAASQNYFWYMVYYIFGNEFDIMGKSQILFLKAVVFPNIRSGDPTTGILTNWVLPRHLCESITFASGEQAQVDALVATQSLDFNQYAQYVWREVYLAESEDAFAYDRTAARNLPTRLEGNNGLYPAPADVNGWMCKFIEWGCPGFYKNTIAGQTYILPCLSGKFYEGKPDFLKNSVDAWFGTKADGSLDPNWATPDNFLAYYGIPYDSDLVIGLLNRSWFVHGNQLSTYGLRYLLGSEDPDSAGGWLGFTQAVLSADTSVEAMLRILYASVDQPKPIPTDANKDSDPCSAASRTGSAVSSLGTAGGIAMCLPWPANLIVGIGAFAAQFAVSDYKCW